MLQRAARNAYSWWWASHIRTKQSKWLDDNLHDMEEKVEYMLKIVENDGDSFRQRAEMYYKHRPELISLVEDAFRGYRALAERYDHLSKELQSANRTIASIYPERVQLDMDEDEPEDFPSTDSPSSGEFRKIGNNIPVAPDAPKLSIPKMPPAAKSTGKGPSRLLSKKGTGKESTDKEAPASVPSGLSKSEAVKEIDKLQKSILAFQTEKEFVKSSYENGVEKYWEIENQITEMQAKVSNLQDEFRVSSFIEDDEARTLMTTTALKSCQETLERLQEKQKQSAFAALYECQKAQEVRDKFKILKEEFQRNQTNQHSEEQQPQPPNFETMNLEKQIDTDIEESVDIEALRAKIQEELRVSSGDSLGMSEMAEKVDALVNKVIKMECEIASQNAYVKKLGSETNALQEHLQGLQQEKESLIENSDIKNNKIRELEEELQSIQTLKKCVADKSNDLQTHLTEASCNLDDLSEKLLYVKPDEEAERIFNPPIDAPGGSPKYKNNEKVYSMHQKGNARSVDQQNAALDDLCAADPSEAPTRSIEDEFKKDSGGAAGSGVQSEAPEESFNPFVDTMKQDSIKGVLKQPESLNPLSGHAVDQGNTQESKRHDLFQKVYGDPYLEQAEFAIEDDQPNWKELFLNGLEDREKILLKEYTSILRSYKEVKIKLNEVEKKKRAGLFQHAIQVKLLRSSNAVKDAEIQSLHKKLNSEQNERDQVLTVPSDDFNPRSPEPDQSELKDTPESPIFEAVDVKEEPSTPVQGGISYVEESEGNITILNVDEAHTFSTTEEKIRLDIDELLEENIEFWLRFSTSFHQIEKFQNSIQDLQAELAKLREKKREGSQGKNTLQLSDVRPIYRHLREILTELYLWVDHNAVLKDDLANRLSSLTSIQEEIARLSSIGTADEEGELSSYQAAKFQGEIMNMKQENNKIANELGAGLARVKTLQDEIQTTLGGLDEELGISRNQSRKAKIPLRSFLFGVKLKKQKNSLFSCVTPSLQKQSSDIGT